MVDVVERRVESGELDEGCAADPSGVGGSVEMNRAEIGFGNIAHTITLSIMHSESRNE